MATRGPDSTCSSPSEPPRLRPGRPAALRRGLIPLAALAALLQAGCSRPAEPEGTSAAAPCAGAFSYAPAPPHEDPVSSELWRGIAVERVSLSWEGDGGRPSLRLEVARLRPPCAGRCPAVLILPILGGGDWISGSIARTLALRGFECLIVEDPQPVFEPASDLGRLREGIVRRVVGARRALDWWLRSPALDASRLGLVGVSFGATVGSLLLQADDRPAAAALVAGGANLPLLLERSAEGEVRRFRTAFLERTGWEAGRLREAAGEVLGDIDPARCAAGARGRPLLFVQAWLDRVVPEGSGRALWESLGRPARVVYPAGHYSLLLFLPDVKRRLADHLAAALGMRRP